MSAPVDNLLGESGYLAFPLRVGRDGPASSLRTAHVREQIEQVLFTSPGERVFRPEFGAGVRGLVFEPAGSALREVASKRLRASLAEALEGEVDARTLEIDVRSTGEGDLTITIAYALATIGLREQHAFAIGAGRG